MSQPEEILQDSSDLEEKHEQTKPQQKNSSGESEQQHQESVNHPPSFQNSFEDPQEDSHQGQSIFPHKKYGNMLVLCQKPFLISIGPDYWCFIPAFIIFGVIAFFMTKFIFDNSTNFWLRLITLIICVGFCLSYLAVAISNPGIQTQDNYSALEEQTNMKNKKTRKCRICNITVKRGTVHCMDCDVCIQQYDHHCPWTSKCIGKGNLCRFYLFLSMVPIFLVYIFIAFSIVMASITQQHQQHQSQIRSHIKKGS